VTGSAASRRTARAPPVCQTAANTLGSRRVVLLAFWALRAPDTDIKLPLAVEGVHLPKPIALTALALAGLYFHLQFGFILNAAITDRLSLETMWKAFAEDGIKWWPPHGGAALLDSQNLLDVWFTANEGYLEGSFMPSGLKGFAIAAEILVGAIYGVVDAVVVVMAVRTVTICSDPKIRFGAAALAGVMIALLAVSQFIFAFGGGHPNHFQFATMLALVGGAWFVHWALKPKTKTAGVPASPPAGAALAI